MKASNTALIIGLSAMLVVPSLMAEITYTLKYSETSPITSLSLENANLRVEGFKYEKPKGFYNLKTDDKKQFTVDKRYALEVIGIEGEDKVNARCSGNSTPKNDTILIECAPK